MARLGSAWADNVWDVTIWATGVWEPASAPPPGEVSDTGKMRRHVPAYAGYKRR